LSLDATKTKYILFRQINSHYNTTGMNIHINNTELERIGFGFEEVSIRLWMDEYLTWKHHIAHANNKISRTMFAIKQVKHFLPIKS